MNRLRPKLFGMVAFALGVAVLTPGVVRADTIVSTTIDNYNFSGHTGGQDFGTITLDLSNDAATVTITVAMASGWGFDTFAFNYGDNTANLSVSGTGWTQNTGSSAGSGFDGYGQFGYETDQNGGASGPSLTETFTVTNGGATLDLAQFTPTSAPPADVAAYFALHLIPVDENGHATGGSTYQAAATHQPSPGPTPPPASTPEPSTIATGLSAFGMLGLVAWRRRSRQAKAANA